MVLETDTLKLLPASLAALEQAFDGLPPVDTEPDIDAIDDVLRQVAVRLRDNFPYPHPLYAGQMLKPPHPIARLAYTLALWINPNNHALDGGRASSAMEKEAVAAIAAMFGWPDAFLGHLASGGTVANLEALWIAGKVKPGKTVVASQQAHYTHSRISGVLGIPFKSVAVDRYGRLDLRALEALLETGMVGTVVATLGTTGFGTVDPLPAILELRQRYDFRIHVDSAYGGYFRLAGNLGAQAASAMDAISEADSIVIDPHKHGLQPYGCGCVLFRDPSLGRYYEHGSPYTYFSSDELHLGEISLECSRAGASAVALWATQRLLPLVRGGEFAGDLEKSRAAALKLYEYLTDDPDELTLFAPELDIVVWAPRAASASAISALSVDLFSRTAARDLHLATMSVPASLAAANWSGIEFDQDSVTCLRSCLMKPEHLDWIDRIWSIYKSVRQ